MPEPQITAKLKAEVAQRANGCCEYCRSQAQFSPDPFSIEHIMPRSQGGNDNSDNLALACQGCNNRKYSYTKARDPVNGELVPLYHPRYQP
jgi:5-methylcytosine-specific restriction endonuclease McrA